MTSDHRCPGCGTSPCAGFACVACWPRLPETLKRGVINANTALRMGRASRTRALDAAIAWLRENPRDRH